MAIQDAIRDLTKVINEGSVSEEDNFSTTTVTFINNRNQISQVFIPYFKGDLPTPNLMLGAINGETPSLPNQISVNAILYNGSCLMAVYNPIDIDFERTTGDIALHADGEHYIISGQCTIYLKTVTQESL